LLDRLDSDLYVLDHLTHSKTSSHQAYRVLARYNYGDVCIQIELFIISLISYELGKKQKTLINDNEYAANLSQYILDDLLILLGGEKLMPMKYIFDLVT